MVSGTTRPSWDSCVGLFTVDLVVAVSCFFAWMGGRTANVAANGRTAPGMFASGT